MNIGKVIRYISSRFPYFKKIVSAPRKTLNISKSPRIEQKWPKGIPIANRPINNSDDGGAAVGAFLKKGPKGGPKIFEAELEP